MTATNRSLSIARAILLVAAATSAGLASVACGGGGGGGAGNAPGLILVEFQQAGEDNLPLNRTLEFDFSSPLDPTDLEIVNPHGARAIIILPPESGDRDTYVIKSMLALTNNPERKAEPYHIIATIHEPENWTSRAWWAATRSSWCWSAS